MGLLTSEGFDFSKKINSILHLKMLNLGFRNFSPKSVLFSVATSSTYGYLFELIFVLLAFGDKGVRVLAAPSLTLLLLTKGKNALPPIILIHLPNHLHDYPEIFNI